MDVIPWQEEQGQSEGGAGRMTQCPPRAGHGGGTLHLSPFIPPTSLWCRQTPILQMTKWGIKETKLLAWDHRTTRIQIPVTARIQIQDGNNSRAHVFAWDRPIGVVNQCIFVAALRNSDPHLITFVSSRVTHFTQRYFHEKMSQWKRLCLPC